MGVTDTAALFSQAPAGPAQDMKYWSGTILTWNPVTLENTVEVGGAVLTNVSVLGVAEAAGYEPGAIVGITSIRTKNGTSTLGILGRFVTPGTSEAEDALSDLSSRTSSQTIATQESTSSGSYTDLTTFGPQIEITVGPSGRLLVIITAQIQAQHNTANPTSVGGFVSVEFGGANVISASTADNTLLAQAQLQSAQAGNHSMLISYTTTAHATFDGLNPGETTLTMKYAKLGGAPTTEFGYRTVTAMAL